MRNLLRAVSLLAVIATPAQTFAQDGEGRRIAEMAFASISGSDRGWIDQGGFVDSGGSVFAAMDYDQNSKLSLSEFLSFDVGLRGVAEEAGRLDAHETAMRVVFAFWDLDGDGLISKTEHGRALNSDFRRADIDDNGRMTLEEFNSGFTVMVALRAAINPAPAE